MKNICLFLFLVFILAACVKNGPFKVPPFTSFEFTGNVQSSGLPMPVQGVLTQRNGSLKFVVAARQGVVLGYGTINPSKGTTDIAFSQSSGIKKLLEITSDALIELLKLVNEGKSSSKHWIIEDNGKRMIYKGPHLELTGRLRDFQ